MKKDRINCLIEELTNEDWKQVCAIYAEGMATGNATFETEIPTWGCWDKSHLKHSRFVARDNEMILGWSALSPVSSRKCYAGVAEVSVYVSQKSRVKGIGKVLLQALIESSEQNGIWTLQAGIFKENRASIALHESQGFRIVGVRERIGQLNNIWRDTVLMERRSKKF